MAANKERPMLMRLVGEAVPVAMFDDGGCGPADTDMRIYAMDEYVLLATHGFGGPLVTPERARVLAASIVEAAAAAEAEALKSERLYSPPKPPPDGGGS